MSWEDTVLKRTEEDSSQWEKRLDQAEVSYKAGYEEGVDAEGWCDGYQKGMRGVVEWVEANGIKDKSGNVHVPKSEWQAKLKEWGLEDREARDKLMAEGYQEMAGRDG